VTLARLHWAGELSGVWVPDAVREAIRDLVQAHEAAMDASVSSRFHFTNTRPHLQRGADIGPWPTSAGFARHAFAHLA
jgi:hypothetical protein